MSVYKLSRRNLPSDVMVLKEIAKRCISARNYKSLLRHYLETRKIKNSECYQIDTASGQYNRMSRLIKLRTTSPDLKTKDAIYVWLHEVGHLCWYKNGNINKKRTRVHAKAFKNLMNRIYEVNYKQKVEPHLPEIIKECEGKRKESITRAIESTKKKAEAKVQRNSIESKLERTRKLIKGWETKQKRANTHLKKLRRREKIYLNRLNKETMT